MLGLFEGDWLGVVVGCDHMNMIKLDEQDKNLIRYVFVIRDTQDMCLNTHLLAWATRGRTAWDWRSRLS